MTVTLSELNLAMFDKLDLAAHGCRVSFPDFVHEFWNCVPGAAPLVWNWHLDVICDELQKVAERVFVGLPKLYDLVISVPPGTSKSSLGSILYPAWIWTRMPEARILSASHTADLVIDLAAKARSVILSDRYRELFPYVELSGDQDSKSHYRNTEGGDRYTCTVAGKSPMGFHSHVQVVDDPIDPKKARSQTELITARQFMTEELPSRKVDKAVTPCILIMQRLGLGDPVDVMLNTAKKEGASPVRYVCLPAELNELVSPYELRERYVEGLLDPRRLSRNVLTQERASMMSHAYETQYNQRPTAPGGSMFKAHLFKCVRVAPYKCRRVMGVDRASTEGGGCYTAIVLMARDNEGNCYVEDVVHGQWEPDERNARIMACALKYRRRYGPGNEPEIIIESEGGSSGRDAWKNIMRKLAGFRVREERVTGAKDVRAEPWADYVAGGCVYLVDNDESRGLGKAEWDVQGFIDEHIHFRPEPGKRLGGLKDRVDASCLLGGTLVSTGRGRVPIECVRCGDVVLTRNGYREVVWSGRSGVVSTLVEVLFSNGSVVCGTPDHLIWTLGMGFTKLIDLVASDSVLVEDGSCRMGSSASQPRLSRRSGSTALRTTNGRVAATFGAVENPCTQPCGSSTTVAFPLAMRYITATKTRVITTLRILSASLRRSMLSGIQDDPYLNGNGNTSNEYGTRRVHGTGARMGGSGTGSMQSTPLVAVPPGRSYAFSANVNFSPDGLNRGIMHSARLCAIRDGGLLRDSTSHGTRLAQLARQFSRGPSRAVSALSDARCGGDGTVPVYDLTVASDPEFFANGILVHNSLSFNRLFTHRRSPDRPILQRIDFNPRRGGPPVKIVAIADKDELAGTVMEQPIILVYVTDPLPKDSTESISLPPHGCTRVIASVTLTMLDMTAEDLQPVWGKPLEGLDLLPEQALARKDDGRKLWGTLLRKHDPAPSLIVFVGDGPSDGRPLSCAMAVCDALRYKREDGFLVLSEQDPNMHKGEPPNKYVYDVIKLSRSSVS